MSFFRLLPAQAVCQIRAAWPIAPCTYSNRAAPGAAATNVSPLTLSKIQTAVRAGYEAQGYQFVEQRNGADFVVAFAIGTRQEISVDSYPAPYSGAWGWHIRGSRYYIHEVSAHSYTQVTLGGD